MFNSVVPVFFIPKMAMMRLLKKNIFWLLRKSAAHTTIIEPENQTIRKSDDPVIQRFLEGDDTAFKELFDQYAPGIYRVVKRYLRSSEIAEDLIEELFTLLRNESDTFDTATLEQFKSSLFEKAKILALRRLSLA